MGLAIEVAIASSQGVSIDVNAPLSDAELDILDERGLDLDYALGVVHAVAVAPSSIAPSQWLPLAFKDAVPDRIVIGLVLRLYNQIVNMLAGGRETMMPEADDDEGCVAFASGYVAAAALDPAWIGHTARWTFAAPFAFLAGRRDLIPANFFEKVPDEREARRILLRDLGKLVYEAYRSFAKERVATARAAHARATSTRVGRNEPCPCGSGKKYKRCCLERLA